MVSTNFLENKFNHVFPKMVKCYLKLSQDSNEWIEQKILDPYYFNFATELFLPVKYHPLKTPKHESKYLSICNYLRSDCS